MTAGPDAAGQAPQLNRRSLVKLGAAVAFAAARSYAAGRGRVGIVCSGGNVDLDALPW